MAATLGLLALNQDVQDEVYSQIVEVAPEKSDLVCMTPLRATYALI